MHPGRVHRPNSVVAHGIASNTALIERAEAQTSTCSSLWRSTSLRIVRLMLATLLCRLSLRASSFESLCGGRSWRVGEINLTWNGHRGYGRCNTRYTRGETERRGTSCMKRWHETSNDCSPPPNARSAFYLTLLLGNGHLAWDNLESSSAAVSLSDKAFSTELRSL